MGNTYICIYILIYTNTERLKESRGRKRRWMSTSGITDGPTEERTTEGKVGEEHGEKSGRAAKEKGCAVDDVLTMPSKNNVTPKTLCERAQAPERESKSRHKGARRARVVVRRENAKTAEPKKTPKGRGRMMGIERERERPPPFVDPSWSLLLFRRTNR